MEIRRVPANWEHPKDQEGEYIPLYGNTYEAHCEEWLAEFAKWEAGVHPDRAANADVRYFWDYEGHPPDSSSYFPPFESAATAYQVYETTSEGTPVSPVFPSEAELKEWLLKEGYTTVIVNQFVARGGMTSTYTVGKGGEVQEEVLFYDV